MTGQRTSTDRRRSNRPRGPRVETPFAAVFAAVAAAALAGCGKESGGSGDGSGAVSLGEPAAFIGGAACAACHVAETEAWRDSHHDLAMQPATPESVLGDFDDAELTAHGVTSRFFVRDGKLFVRTDGPDGEIGDYPITYTFGVFPLQQYLVELPRGRRQALTIAWDSRPAEQGGQRWFHLHGDDAVDSSSPLHWTRPVHTWNTRCAACHSTALEKAYGLDGDRFDTRWADVDVGCEACHGPGSLHAAAPSEHRLGATRRSHVWVRDDGAPTARRVPAPDGERGGTEVETCAQCHSRRGQLADALAPREPLLERFVPALLEDGLYHADGQILDEVFVYGSFVQSAMYAAGVTCGDCHEPHGTGLVADGNALCAQCHAPAQFDDPGHHRHEPDTAGAFCVDCHMRAETYMVVDPRRDHSFRVPRPDLSRTLGIPNACGDCHAAEGPEWAAARVRGWFPDGRAGSFHYGEAIAAGREWSADRAELLIRVVDDASLPAIVRATAIRHLGEQVDAAAVDRISRALDGGDPLVQHAALEALAARPAERRASLGQRFLTHDLRALRVTAARVLVDVRSALSERRRADLDAALNEYFAVQRYNADSSEGWVNRGAVEAVLGRSADAEVSYREAIRREPTFAPAYAQLAELYRGLGREVDADAVLTEGIAANPDDPGLHYALGLSRVRSERLDDALPLLERAAALNGREPLYPYAASLAYASAGSEERAIDALAAAHDRFPGHAPTLLALATLHRDAGDIERALDYTRRLLEVSPSDPRGRGLLGELEVRARDE